MKKTFIALLFALVFTLACASSLSEAVLPMFLKSVQEEAFSNNQALRTVVIPDGTESIGARAFAGCSNLEFVYIPDSVTFIGEDAFDGCAQDFIIDCGPDCCARAYAEENGLNCTEPGDDPAQYAWAEPDLILLSDPVPVHIFVNAEANNEGLPQGVSLHAVNGEFEILKYDEGPTYDFLIRVTSLPEPFPEDERLYPIRLEAEVLCEDGSCLTYPVEFLCYDDEERLEDRFELTSEYTQLCMNPYGNAPMKTAVYAKTDGMGDLTNAVIRWYADRADVLRVTPADDGLSATVETAAVGSLSDFSIPQDNGTVFCEITVNGKTYAGSKGFHVFNACRTYDLNLGNGINPETYSMEIGNSAGYGFGGSGSNTAFDEEIYVWSDRPEVLSVDANFRITALSAGTANFYFDVYYNDPAHEHAPAIRRRVLVTVGYSRGVCTQRMDLSDISLEIGETAFLPAPDGEKDGVTEIETVYGVVNGDSVTLLNAQTGSIKAVREGVTYISVRHKCENGDGEPGAFEGVVKVVVRGSGSGFYLTDDAGKRVNELIAGPRSAHTVRLHAPDNSTFTSIEWWADPNSADFAPEVRISADRIACSLAFGADAHELITRSFYGTLYCTVKTTNGSAILSIPYRCQHLADNTGENGHFRVLSETEYAWDLYEIGQKESLFTQHITTLPRENVILSFTSSDPDVVTVDANGVMTAVAPGSAHVECNISVPLTGETYTIRCAVFVLTDRPTAQSVTQTQTGTVTRVNGLCSLSARLSPLGSTADYEWTVSDESVATVESFGVDYGNSNVFVNINALKSGNVTVSGHVPGRDDLDVSYAVSVLSGGVVLDGAVYRADDVWLLEPNREYPILLSTGGQPVPVTDSRVQRFEGFMENRENVRAEAITETGVLRVGNCAGNEADASSLLLFCTFDDFGTEWRVRFAVAEGHMIDDGGAYVDISVPLRVGAPNTATVSLESSRLREMSDFEWEIDADDCTASIRPLSSVTGASLLHLESSGGDANEWNLVKITCRYTLDGVRLSAETALRLEP